MNAEREKIRQQVSEEYKQAQETPLPDMDVEGLGKWGKYKKGLWSDQLEEILQSHTKMFIPVITADEVSSLSRFVNPRTKEFGFIFNLYNEKVKRGMKHWCACWISIPDGSVEYYNPLASPDPTKSFMKQLKVLINKINPEVYLKFKVNRIVDESDNSSNCGFFSLKFILDRIDGKPWKYATLAHKSDIGEYNIERFKNYL
jgi:hypothetical protein